MSDPTVSFIFCEDYRPEVNGKFSLMGVYTGFVGLTAERATLRQFCTVAMVELDRAHAQDTIKLDVFAGDELQAQIESNLLEAAKQPSPAGAPPDRMWVPIVMQGIQVTLVAGKHLKAVVSLDGQAIGESLLRVVCDPELHPPRSQSAG